jgi:hypothetical protein
MFDVPGKLSVVVVVVVARCFLRDSIARILLMSAILADGAAFDTFALSLLKSFDVDSDDLKRGCVLVPGNGFELFDS